MGNPAAEATDPTTTTETGDATGTMSPLAITAAGIEREMELETKIIVGTVHARGIGNSGETAGARALPAAKEDTIGATTRGTGKGRGIEATGGGRRIA